MEEEDCMTKQNKGTGRLFAGMSEDESRKIIEVCDKKSLMAGEILFQEGETADTLWIIQSGRVDIFKNIRAEIDRTLASLGAGEVIGEMGFIDHSSRSAGARTTETTEFQVLSLAAFQQIEQNHPALAAQFFRNLSIILAERLRTTIELYRESVVFCIEATGAGRLNLLALSEELKPVSLLLSSGTTVSGHILQMDQSPAGYTIVIKDKNGKLGIIPYQAIQQITLE
jgi:CRP-like cAMP-binding protein